MASSNNFTKKASKSVKVANAESGLTPRLRENTYITFWGPKDQNPVFGQWWKSDFTFNRDIVSALPDEIQSLELLVREPDTVERLVDLGHVFNCAEQFMMASKASLFDPEMIDHILQETNPAQHRTLGRRIKNFDQTKWDTYCQDIVILGNYLKFSQNMKLCDTILDTGSSTLVEGSPLDRIWGVGLKYNNPLIHDKRNWRGENKLGTCLMKVREILQNKYSAITRVIKLG
jgi:ribA/ribD-fused uncharacterized protein